jgi:hypothetical protein
MNPVREAHLRLLSTLPVRTHYKPYKETRENAHFMTPVRCMERKKRIRELKANGKAPKEIARLEGCSIMTVYNHLRIR